MSSNVKVSGIPSHIKFGKLIPLFSNILQIKPSDFLLRILTTKGPVNEILLSLPSYSEAQSAQEKLDNFVYKFDKITYVFNAEMTGGYNQNTKKPVGKSKYKNTNKQNRQSYGYNDEEEYHRDRSRSPHYKDKSSELDMQLEILRKQRMIIEEERKLLEEQKKLDELKRKSNSQNSNEDVESGWQSSTSAKTESDSKQPNIHRACEVLVAKMKVFVRKHSSPEESTALTMHLQSLIKQRLAMVDSGRGKYSISKLIQLYRSKYPPSEDEKFVKEALEDVKEGRTDPTEIDQASAKGGNAKNKPDVTESAADIAEEKVTKKFEERRLYFFKSSGALMKRMRDLIYEYSTPETRKMLQEYLRYTLKQRLAAVVNGQPIYQTYKIINLYREKHPPEDDEVLIKQLANDIEEGRMPEDVMSKDKQKKHNLNQDDTNTTEADKVTVEKVTDNSGPSETKESVDENGGNAEENNDLKEDNEENKEKGTIEVCPEVKTDKNEDIDNTSSSDIMGVEFGKEPKNSTCDNITGNDIKKDLLATEANEKTPDNVKVNEESKGIKRKTEEDENNCIKVAKTNDVALSCENTSILEDKN